MLRTLGILILLTVGILVVIQFVPYGRDHANPPVVQEPAWDSPRTRELAKTACFDCHSNETVWPAYASVAPVSWLVAHDVDEGRAKLNFSEWNRTYDEADEAAELVEKGEMPLAQYLLMHADARLSEADREALIQGLQATLGTEGERGEAEDND